MRKNIYGRHFKRDANERKALFRGLMSSLVLEERIKTTEEKGKAIKGSVEKLVTRAKKGGTHVETRLSPYLNSEAIKKMVQDIAPRFTDRPGGYTRIVRLERRFSDNAAMVLIEWVEKPKALTATAIKDKKSAKKIEKKEIKKATAKADKTTAKSKKPEAKKEKGKK